MVFVHEIGHRRAAGECIKLHIHIFPGSNILEPVTIGGSALRPLGKRNVGQEGGEGVRNGREGGKIKSDLDPLTTSWICHYWLLCSKARTVLLILIY